ncbi:hypothetical protein SKAU_G00141670 [Synaphobranchus kaupii]|uniref:Uncharacterized protein n=1 Tax=Synaphobranchus kaupii TaxID=118154 RepID=A0A9Q1FSD5_SYNKA|nr:hypothetical protein SKAU_G00141670 [Synaphobranchus kaupii]
MCSRGTDSDQTETAAPGLQGYSVTQGSGISSSSSTRSSVTAGGLADWTALTRFTPPERNGSWLSTARALWGRDGPGVPFAGSLLRGRPLDNAITHHFHPALWPAVRPRADRSLKVSAEPLGSASLPAFWNFPRSAFCAVTVAVTSGPALSPGVFGHVT